MNYKIEVTPRSEREVLIDKRIKNASDFSYVVYEFRGDKVNLPVIHLPIHLPVYRMDNCRAFSAQQTEIATKGLDKNFFSKGQELNSTNQIQHNILVRLANEERQSIASIVKTLESEGQRESILISHTGVVVNGNRRLAAMRELYQDKDGTVDNRFSYVNCAVLPSDTTRDEIDDIEAELQARPQTKLEYDWIGDAQLVRRQIEKGRSTKDVAARLRRSKSDIVNTLQALDEADLYLSEWVGKPGNYELVSSEGQQIFGDIPKNLKNKSPELQNASRAIAWSLFENRKHITGRVYRLNAAFGKLAPKVCELLASQLEIESKSASSDTDEEGFEVDIEPDENNDDFTPIIELLRNEETKANTTEALIESCEVAIELDKEQNVEKAALKALTQVNTKLSSVNVNTAGLDTLPAILKQIETIQDLLLKMESEIKKRQ